MFKQDLIQPSGEADHYPARILVIEENAAEREVLVKAFKDVVYVVLEAVGAEAGVKVAMANSVDACVFGWKASKTSGPEFCQEIRNKGYSGGIVLIGETGDHDVHLAAIQAGADDFWHKPVSLTLAKARMEALLRRMRRQVLTQGVIAFKNLQLDTERGLLSNGSESVQLSAKEAGTLRVLLEANGAVVSREVLFARVWRYDYLPKSRTVDNYVMRLRHALRKLSAGAVGIQAVRHSGYLLQWLDADTQGVKRSSARKDDSAPVTWAPVAHQSVADVHPA